jgi:enterobactin synthetase component D
MTPKLFADTGIEFIRKETLLVSNHLTTFLCEYSIKYFSDDLFEQLDISTPTTILNSVQKRRAEFLAGRIAAKNMLKHLKSDSTDVKIGEQRNPVWPKGYIGSISHTSNLALCSAGLVKEYKYIGIDLENWIDAYTIEQIKDTILSSKEESILRKTDIDFEKAFTLVFSAKESLFKALYSKVGHFFDFSVAEVYRVSLSEGAFELVLLQDLHPSLKSGRKFKGYFQTINESVFTYIVE